ncbi:MAG: polysaccharide deacetylase family protein, partial [Chloroflexi bacterium]|nr:polysaccharide deacetylase family protein [Chloroflexota bacterium]
MKASKRVYMGFYGWRKVVLLWGSLALGFALACTSSGVVRNAPVPTSEPIVLATPTPTSLATPTPPAWQGGNSVPTPTPQDGVLAAHTTPPGGLAPNQVPQFVVFGSDGNYQSSGNNWLVYELFGPKKNPQGAGNPRTFDGEPVLGTFYVTGQAEEMGRPVWESLYNAWLQGHEIGNRSYGDKGNLSPEQWRDEIARTQEFLTRPLSQGGLGIPASHIVGFRAPEDRYNPDLFKVLEEFGFRYDASIVEGYQFFKDGTNEAWPYALVEGSSSALYMYERGIKREAPPGSHPDLWELPPYVYRVPPV